MGVSLDSYIAGPDGNDWAAPYAELHRFHNQQTNELGLHLLGRRLNEIMTLWETAEEHNSSALDYQLEFARIWKQLPELVFSKSLEAVEGNARLSRADPVRTVQAFKEEDGGPIAVGGADLAATLTAHQLIDEYHFVRQPRGPRRSVSGLPSSSSSRLGPSTTSSTTTPGRRRWSTSPRHPAIPMAPGRER
jgi:dihydrofolate reductase